MSNSLLQGDVLLIKLPSHQPRGREQEGQRPAIVVGIPFEKLRYPILLIAPLTTQAGTWADQNPVLYPRLKAGSGGYQRNLSFCWTKSALLMFSAAAII